MGCRYIKNSLSRDEEIMYIAKFHWFKWMAHYIYVIFAVLLSASVFVAYRNNILTTDIKSVMLLVAFFLFLMMSIASYVDLVTKEMGITNKRVIFKKGFIHTDSDELLLNKIESIEIEQSLWGRIFGYGDMFFAGTGTTKVEFRDVSRPVQLKKHIEELM